MLFESTWFDPLRLDDLQKFVIDNMDKAKVNLKTKKIKEDRLYFIGSSKSCVIC